MLQSYDLPLEKSRNIAIFGATGHTGQFVVAELCRRGMTPIAIARSSAKLMESQFQNLNVITRCASVNDPSSLDDALRDVFAVINCAGPFLETAEVVAGAALRSGVHYLDISAEQLSTQTILNKYDDMAREADLLFLPAMGFYGGFGDLLATAAMNGWDFADEIRIIIALDSWHPTQGTRLTGRLNTTQRQIIVDGNLSPLPQPASEIFWDFSQPFGHQDVIELPFSEVILIARHLKTTQLHSYLNRAPLRDLRDPATPLPKAVDGSGRSAQIFMVDVVVEKDSCVRRITAQGQDIYAFTAPFVCEAVARIVKGEVQDRGAQAPGAVFDAQDYLRTLTPELTYTFWQSE